MEWNTEGGKADESAGNEDEKRGESKGKNLKRRFRKLIPDSRDKVIHIENSDMGASRHGQGGTCPLRPWKCCIFFLLQMLSKTPIAEVNMHHFEKMS